MCFFSSLREHNQKSTYRESVSYIFPCLQDPSGTKLVSSAIPRKEMQKCRVRSNISGRRSSYHRLQRKYIKFLNEGVDVSRRAYKSLAVSNAVELFKLVFLSTSTAPVVPNLLAETLRRYSEHDLFAAFNYLREAKIMVNTRTIATSFVVPQSISLKK